MFESTVTAGSDKGDGVKFHAQFEENSILMSLYPNIKISKHVLVEVDSRPLFSFAFHPIRATHYDNWELQFKPDDWVDHISVATAESPDSHAIVAKDRASPELSLMQSVAGEGDDDGSTIVPD